VNKITVITLVLFSVGISSGLLILYDYLTSLHLITREQAYDIATRVGHWNQNFLSDKTINMKLLHIQNNGLAFTVDEKTLEDVRLLCPQNGLCGMPREIHEVESGKYVWIVTLTGQNPVHYAFLQWGYVIDATNGQVLPIVAQVP
jgi:hypothetical protein